MDFDLDNMDERYKKIYERFQKNETISAIDLERKIDHVISPKDSIDTINKHIKKDGLVLSKTRDETTGKSYLLLRHIYKTHDDCWKSLQVPGGATLWSTTEKTNLHEIATRILSEENKQVWVDSKDEEIRNTYERLLEHKWLNFEKKNSTLTLGPRFLGQMKPWIEWKTQKQYHCDACSLCVVRGYFCDDCDNAHHLMCLKKSKTDPKCQTCQSTMKNNLGLNEYSEGQQSSKKQKLDNERVMENKKDDSDSFFKDENGIEQLKRILENKKKRQKINGVLKERLQKELTKPLLQKMFQENIQYLENIQSGKIHSWRHENFHNGNQGTRQALFFRQITNPFSDDQVQWTYDEMKNLWVNSESDFWRINDYINKVLLSDCLIKFYMDHFKFTRDEAETRIGESPFEDDSDDDIFL